MKKFVLLIFLISSKLAFSQNSYVGEIRMFAGNFAPIGWEFCNGQFLSIAENEALFQLIGTTYGGDGQITFAVPDLRGRVAVGPGQGAGLINVSLAQSGGAETVTLVNANMPAHTHDASIMVNNQNGTISVPTSTSSIAVSSIKSGRSSISNLTFNNEIPDILLANVTTTNTGNSVPVNTVKPILGINHIISLYGIFPSGN